MKAEIDPLIDRREVCRLTSLSRSQLYRLERAGQFPERLQIGPGRVAWLQSEINEWIISKRSTRVRTSHTPHNDKTIDHEVMV